jgi:DNA-directed RNA polymerase
MLDRVEAVRITRNVEHREFIKAADKSNHIMFCQRALDILGSTAWIINHKILKIAIYFWNNNINVPGLPNLYEPVKINPPEKDAHFTSVINYKKKLREQEQKLRDNFSQRCDVVYKLDISRAVFILN